MSLYLQNKRNKKIVHVLNADKFFEDYILFLKNRLIDFEENHIFYVTGNSDLFFKKNHCNVIFQKHQFFKFFSFYLSLILDSFSGRKVIFHGLYNQMIIKIFSFLPLPRRKLFWVIMGGDLYAYRNRVKVRWWRNELFRLILIKRIGNFITHIKGDYDLACQVYKTRSKWFYCFMYPSNFYGKVSPSTKKTSKFKHILVGNSADPSNNHFLIFDKLSKIENNAFKIYVPLSYGDSEYASRVISNGKKHFGKRFIPLIEFLPKDVYLNLISNIEIAIFAHNRQQALGNMISLISMGKKVYLRNSVTPWNFFKDKGLKVYNLDDLNLNSIDLISKERNIQICQELFSPERLIEQWKEIFDV